MVGVFGADKDTAVGLVGYLNTETYVLSREDREGGRHIFKLFDRYGVYMIRGGEEQVKADIATAVYLLEEVFMRDNAEIFNILPT